MRDAVAQGDSTVADDRNDFVEIMVLFLFFNCLEQSEKCTQNIRRNFGINLISFLLLTLRSSWRPDPSKKQKRSNKFSGGLPQPVYAFVSNMRGTLNR